MACKGCAQRRAAAKAAIAKTFARANVLKRRVLAKKQRTDKNV